MNTRRTIDDDMLSAYLDGELPAQDLRDVRTALAKDPALAARLAALQSVNDLVLRHAKALDATPLPASVLSLLQAADQAEAAGMQSAHAHHAHAGATIVQGPWQRWSRHAGAQLALAATLVLALGLALNNLLEPAKAELPALAAYTEMLDSSPSGVAVPVNGATLVNRFSFRDQDGRYCRQYQLSTATSGSENVACRTEQGWTLAATLPVPVQATPEVYQPASSSPELNAVLDRMMQGAALDLPTEATLIGRRWRD
jgi:negative regulator of sigma E activity